MTDDHKLQTLFECVNTNEPSITRLMALTHPDVPVEGLIRCSESVSWEERHAIAKNSSTPKDILEQLKNDSNDLVVSTAIKNLQERFLYKELKGKDTPEDLNNQFTSEIVKEKPSRMNQSKTMQISNNTTNQIDLEDVKIGDYFSQIQYYRVVKVNPKSVILINKKGIEQKFDKDLLGQMCSASLYHSEQTVTITEINQILAKTDKNIFTVNFNKQVKKSDITNKLLSAIKDDEGKPLDYENIAKSLKKISGNINIGEERTLTGYLVELSNEMGRSVAIDLEIEQDKDRRRQIDHRTINWLVFDGTKYIVG